MNSDSPDLKTAMLERIRADAPRKVWTPSYFVDLASRDAVDKALQRLTKVGTLRRIDRGLYDQPSFNCIWSMRNGSRTFSLSTSSGNSQGLDWMPTTIAFEDRYTPSTGTQSWAAIKTESGANPWFYVSILICLTDRCLHI